MAFVATIEMWASDDDVNEGSRCSLLVSGVLHVDDLQKRKVAQPGATDFQTCDSDCHHANLIHSTALPGDGEY